MRKIWQQSNYFLVVFTSTTLLFDLPVGKTFGAVQLKCLVLPCIYVCIVRYTNFIWNIILLYKFILYCLGRKATSYSKCIRYNMSLMKPIRMCVSDSRQKIIRKRAVGKKTSLSSFVPRIKSWAWVYIHSTNRVIATTQLANISKWQVCHFLFYFFFSIC